MSLAYEAAENIRHEANGRPVHIIYVGDYDPAGVLIDKDIEGKLSDHLPDHEITFHRIAVTPEQIDLMRLPTKPPKKGDRRGGFIGGTVEAEAIPAHVLRGILEDKIESFIPLGQLHTLEAAEASERESIAAIASRLREVR